MVSFGQVRMASTLSGSARIRPDSMICPRYFTDIYPKKHFFHFAYNFSLCNLSNTARKSNICYSRVGLKTRMSSKYIVMHHIRSEKDKFMRCWNIVCALVKPIGITTYSYNPCGVKKAVLCHRLNVCKPSGKHGSGRWS